MVGYGRFFEDINLLYVCCFIVFPICKLNAAWTFQQSVLNPECMGETLQAHPFIGFFTLDKLNCQLRRAGDTSLFSVSLLIYPVPQHTFRFFHSLNPPYIVQASEERPHYKKGLLLFLTQTFV